MSPVPARPRRCGRPRASSSRARPARVPRTPRRPWVRLRRSPRPRAAWVRSAGGARDRVRVATAGDEHDVLEALERAGGGVPVRRLRVVDVLDAPDHGDQLHPVRETGPGRQRAPDRGRVGADLDRGRGGGERVGDVVRRARRRRGGDDPAGPGQHPVAHAVPTVGRLRVREPHHAPRRAGGEPRGDGVVGVEHEHVAGRWCAKTRAFAAAYASTESCQSRWSSATLSSTATSGTNDSVVNSSWNDDTSATTTSASSPVVVEERPPDVAGRRAPQSGLRAHRRDQRGHRRLAVGAGDGDEARRRFPRAAVRPRGRSRSARAPRRRSRRRSPDGRAGRRGSAPRGRRRPREPRPLPRARARPPRRRPSCARRARSRYASPAAWSSTTTTSSPCARASATTASPVAPSPTTSTRISRSPPGC